MANHHAALKQSIFDDIVAHLTVHLQNCRSCVGKVVLRTAVPTGKIAVGILEVGEINLNLSLQCAQCLHTLIAARVPHDGDGERPLKCLQYSVGVLRGTDEVDIVRTLCNQIVKNGAQFGDGYRFSEVFMADAAVLTKHTAEDTAGEKYGSRAMNAADIAEFLPEGFPR